MCAQFLFIGQFMEILPNNKHVFLSKKMASLFRKEAFFEQQMPLNN